MVKAIKRHICRHLRAVGLSKTESARVSSLTAKWLKNNGYEWTAKRFKSLRSTLKLNLATGSYRVPEGFATRRNSKGKVILKDGLFHRLLCAKTDRQIQIALNVFMCDSFLVLDKPSATQLNKFDTAVTGDITYDPQRLADFTSAVKSIIPKKFGQYMYELQSNFADQTVLPLRYWPPSDKKSPVFGYTENRARCNQSFYDFDDPYKHEAFKDVKDPKTGKVVDYELRDPNFKWNQLSYEADFDDATILSLERRNISTSGIDILSISKPWNELCQRHSLNTMRCLFGDYPDSYTRVIPEIDIRVPDPVIGTVSHIQEPSCKLRSVASPFLAIQALGEPLKIKTDLLSRMIPEVVTHDQASGQRWAQDMLSKGNTIYAFDASSYTDRLPIKLQLDILRSFRDLKYCPIDQFDIDVMDLASSGKYLDTKRKKIIQWTQGQPQGFGPSFHVACITHAVILEVCCYALHIDGEKPYRVIGDDVVIGNAELAKLYSETMTEVLGVSINYDKSLISNKISEFAGKVVTEDYIVPNIKPKFRTHTADSLLKLLQFYGKRFLHHLFDNERPLIKKAFLPFCLGGLNLKLHGSDITLEWDQIRKHVLRKELKSFVKPYGDTSVKSFFTRVAAFDDLNDHTIAETEIGQWLDMMSNNMILPIDEIESKSYHMLSNGVRYAVRDQQYMEQKKLQGSPPSALARLVGSMIRHELSNPRLFDSNIRPGSPSKEWLGSFGLPLDYVNIILGKEGYQIGPEWATLVSVTRTHHLGDDHTLSNQKGNNNERSISEISGEFSEKWCELKEKLAQKRNSKEIRRINKYTSGELGF